MRLHKRQKDTRSAHEVTCDHVRELLGINAYKPFRPEGHLFGSVWGSQILGMVLEYLGAVEALGDSADAAQQEVFFAQVEALPLAREERSYYCGEVSRAKLDAKLVLSSGSITGKMLNELIDSDPQVIDAQVKYAHSIRNLEALIEAIRLAVASAKNAVAAQNRARAVTDALYRRAVAACEAEIGVTDSHDEARARIADALSLTEGQRWSQDLVDEAKQLCDVAEQLGTRLANGPHTVVPSPAT